ncbi:periplasmic nitrate reductase, NapE protein [Agaribacterium haliotis]|uniref:periplasmic nitrate reductase, NapE protein n=1 Tax=Agaribacterium haliotis TaxID=2013869 RepID=UPI000BB56510|nr:periplasmic nitrate reductase, NapE protein [Agaribacterium haliotis]
MNKETDQITRGRELRSFLFITVVLFPALSVALVGALGFGIWMSQLIFGPPGV